MQKEWIIKKVSDKPVLDKLLELRGIVKPEDKQEFLNPLEFPIIPPARERYGVSAETSETRLVPQGVEGIFPSGAPSPTWSTNTPAA